LALLSTLGAAGAILLLLLQAHCQHLLLSMMLLLLRVLSWQPRWMHCGSSWHTHR
jgi:hypothetical protein